jgi:hypothetical protein
MTSTEMVTAFKFRLDKTDSLNYPNFTNTEVDLLLNQAQERIVKQRYGTTNTKRESFEETQKRTEDLKAIVSNAIITPAPTAIDNIDVTAQFVTLPQDHWFIVQERATLGYLDCNNAPIERVVPVYGYQHNDINKVINNSFLRANKNRVLRIMEAGRVELVSDPITTLVNYRLRYIRKPLKISSIVPLVNCELSNHIHDEIVDQAVFLALEDIEAKRMQTYNPIEKTNE